MKLRTVTASDERDLDRALWALRVALKRAKYARTPNAAKAIRRAIKSTEGARRHVIGVLGRQARAAALPDDGIYDESGMLVGRAPYAVPTPAGWEAA